MPTMPGTFRPRGMPTRQEQSRDYDRRRGSASERGYDHRWTKASIGYRRSHPLCVGCEAVGRVTAAEVVDHVVPHKGDSRLFWDRDNWQSACGWHHDVVKQRLELMWQRGDVPASALRLDSDIAMRISRDLDPSI